MAKESRFSKAKYQALKVSELETLKQLDDVWKKVYGDNWKKIKELVKIQEDIIDNVEWGQIQEQINQLAIESLNYHSKAKLAEYKDKMIKLRIKFKSYEDAIYKLLNKDTKKFFERYAKQMFEMSVDIIATHLPDNAINFYKLSDDKRLNFLQVFMNHITHNLGVSSVKVFYSELGDNCGAVYKQKVNGIAIDKNLSTDMQYVIGMVLHEFTHHLYWKHPNKTPIGRRKTDTVMQHVDTSHPSSEQGFKEYMKRPHEAPAYYLQDYFVKHKFGKSVLLEIKKRQLSQFNTKINRSKRKKGLFVYTKERQIVC